MTSFITLASAYAYAIAIAGFDEAPLWGDMCLMIALRFIAVKRVFAEPLKRLARVRLARIRLA